MENGPCPLCQQPAKPLANGFNQPNWDCPTCGFFGLSESAVHWVYEVRRATAAPLYKLSAFTREQSLKRNAPGSFLPRGVLLSDSSRGLVLSGAVSLTEAEAAFPRTVSVRLDRFMLNLARMQPTPGRAIPVTARDYSLAYAEDWGVADFLAMQLQDVGWIKYEHASPNLDAIKQATITVEGWNRVAELQRTQSGRDSTQAFVAMWFSPDMGGAYDEGLAAGIQAAGYDSMRIDKAQHNNKIDDEIIAEIRKSRFLVADFTGHRGGVYFEAGFAMGLGMPVIWTCRKDHLKDAHFDTRQYNHITWEAPEELKTLLHQRIEATIGRGPV